MRRESIPALTGVRFIAALGVVLHHVWLNHLAIFPPALGPLFALGRDGVDLFFVLSGYVLAYNYGPWFETGLERRWEFLWIRVARIYPLALAALVLTVPVLVLADPKMQTTPLGLLGLSFLTNALLVQTWLPVPGVAVTWDAPAWSISVEMLAYFFFPPLAFAILPKIRTLPRFALALAVSWLLGFAALLLAIAVAPPDSLAPYFTPLVRIWEFIAGTLLVGRPAIPRCWRDPGLVLIAALVMLTAYRPTIGLLTDREWYLVAFPLSIAAVWLLASGPSRIGNTLGNRGIVALGDASYALYLLHWPAIILAWALIGLPTLQAGAWLAVVAVLLPLSLASYRYVESPARRWLRQHRPSRRQGVAVGAGVGVNG